MSMVGRSRNRSRLVTLVAVAATLLAAWLPAARACACEPVTAAAAIPSAGSVPVCPCCGTRPSADAAPRPCCVSHAKAAEPRGCECGSPTRPGNPEPTAPPRPAGPDDSHVLTATLGAPVVGLVPVLAGPTAAETVARLADPPPADLVISLSRITR